MGLGRALGRAMIGSMFIYGGQNAFRHAEMLTPGVEDKLRTWAPWLVDRAGSTTLVKANGAAMVAAGSTLALGILPKASAAVLLGSLVPTTAAGHAFWEQEDPGARARHTTGFLSNVAAGGGLLLVLATRRKRSRDAD